MTWTEPEVTAVPATPTSRGLSWLFRDRQTGQVVLYEPPNPALAVWLASRIATTLDVPALRSAGLGRVGAGALLAWSADELLRGTTPYRRLLGAAVLGWQVRGLVR